MAINYLPLQDISEDKLNFSNEASRIARFINEFPNDTPCAISINGSWGTGKSSMMNFVEVYIDPKKCDVIRFNPWMIDGKEQLLFSLFEEIYYCIEGEEYTKLKKSFLEYAQKLSSPIVQTLASLGATSCGTSPGVTTTIAAAAGKFVGDISSSFFSTPLSKRKKELEENLREMCVENQRKIVIMIDEIDRLFPEEIIAIFQIIKCSLSFPGLLFVVAMDEPAVYDGIKKAGVEKPTEYIQKIFQRSYRLNEKHQLRTLNNEFLQNKIAERTEKPFDGLGDALNAILNIDEKHYIFFDDARQNVINTYIRLHNSIRNEFENPRTFLKFVDLIMDRWANYYDELFSQKTAQANDIQAALLMLIVHFKYPEFTDGRSMETDIGAFATNPHTIPLMVDNAAQLIKKICPPTKDGDTRYDIKFYAAIALHKFPDSSFWDL